MSALDRRMAPAMAPRRDRGAAGARRSGAAWRGAGARPRPARRRSRPSPAAASGASSPTSTSCPACSRRPPATPAARSRTRATSRSRRETTGHAESVEIAYDPKRISYEQLLDHFWHSIDPTTKDRQFCDVGSPVPHAIFVHGAAQRRAAEASLAELQKTKPFKEPIVTQIVDAGPFYPAEAYHQDYYKKNPVRYHYYRSACGRDARLAQLWGAARRPVRRYRSSSLRPGWSSGRRPSGQWNCASALRDRQVVDAGVAAPSGPASLNSQFSLP